MKRVILGSLLGYLFTELTTVITHQLLYAQMVPADSSPRTQYLAVITVADILFAILGGWLCATVSLKAREAILTLVIVGELSRIALTVLLWDAVPHFYNFVGFWVYPPAVWFGSWISSNRSD